MAVPGLAGVALNTVGEAIAFAAGVAIGPTLSPVSTALVQEAWQVAQIKAVDPGTAAAIVAEDVEQRPWGLKEASMHGIDQERFDAIVGETRDAPGLAELFAMLRRETITAEQFIHGLRKGKLELLWDVPLEDLQHERIDPSVVATSIQRGLMHDPGYLPTAIDFSGANVPAPEVSPLDAEKEAAASGISAERLAVYTRIVGLPPSPGELLQLLNRGEINTAAFRMGIAEGNTRNEWADKLLTLRRHLLTPHEYQEAALRGLLTNAQADQGSALSGLNAADSKTLFGLLGRPLDVHQITTGLARGGTFGGDYSTVPEPYQDAIRRSAIRPEYAHLAYANRYSLPGAFVLRALAQGGDLTPDETHTLLLESGWKPDLAKTVSDKWTAGTKAGANKHVTSAETGLFTVLRKAYVNDEATETQAGPILTDLGVDVPDHARIFSLWNHERALVRATLTPVQIRKAVGQPGKDKTWALARLADLGYTPDDAETFLAE